MNIEHCRRLLNDFANSFYSNIKLLKQNFKQLKFLKREFRKLFAYILDPIYKFFN